MGEVPFPPNRQLCSELAIEERPPRRLIKTIKRAVEPTVPTRDVAVDDDYLPGQPWVRLRDDQETVSEFLKKETLTCDLDELAPHMWLLATQNSTHISSLTHQRVRGRQIVATEDPGLHLLWIYDRVFIKPLPEYLLSHAFWDYYLVDKASPIPLADREAILRAAKGFLRSYAFLIKSNADYLLATHDDSLGLVPKSISFPQLVGFLRCFKDIPDREVSPRYGYGGLRLTRLNFWAKVFLRRAHYFKSHGQYGAYFSQYYGPVLFVFAIVSVALGSMQVVLGVEADFDSGHEWASFAWMSRGFSVSILFVVLILALVLLGDLLFLVLREVIFTAGYRYGKKGLVAVDGGPESLRSSTKARGEAAADGNV
ncbi:uncharacterized protein DNG_06202 [Cephalotrichum gorgonifer]|uniref:Uncharacterized protein n=1 Tax=Cephalotrichum gorgonifer TaxID=2041049 RepID=A0AAE8N184_9PEZI|nr:uncharacterized protein DNG_06202 [Cephalotrichum gorgonifer]